MKPAEYEVLQKVKTALNMTGTFHDDTLKLYIQQVKEYLLDAGVSEEVLESNASVGAILRGVIDLWQYDGNSVHFSDFFYQRAIQLCYRKEEKV